MRALEAVATFLDQHVALKGVLGVGGVSTGVVVSWLPQIEAGLRIASLAIGIAVGVATFLSIIRKK